MLGTFPNDFPKLQLPKGIFTSGNFPNVEFTKRQLPKSVLAAAIGPHCSLRRLRGPNLTCGKLLLGKLHIWESPLEKCLWESIT